MRYLRSFCYLARAEMHQLTSWAMLMIFFNICSLSVFIWVRWLCENRVEILIFPIRTLVSHEIFKPSTCPKDIFSLLTSARLTILPDFNPHVWIANLFKFYLHLPSTDRWICWKFLHIHHFWFLWMLPWFWFDNERTKNSRTFSPISR